MRKISDYSKLCKTHKVETVDNSVDELLVDFNGPKDSLYEGGKWKLRVMLPDDYPYKSPSIGFTNKIYHPNIDFASGSICLDVINQTWTPVYDLCNIFEQFLPQLLQYPNADDPLNICAAQTYKHDRNRYEKMVRYCVGEYATPEKSSKSEESKPIKKRICAACGSRMGQDSDTEPISKKRRFKEGDLKHEDETSDDSTMSDDEFENDDLDEELTMEM